MCAFVPELIYDVATVVKVTLQSSIAKMCGTSTAQRLHVANTQFSAPDYFFVSKHVARALPHLLVRCDFMRKIAHRFVTSSCQ